MKYYKDPQENIYGYNGDGSQDSLIPSSYVAITDIERDDLIDAKTPKPTKDDLIAAIESTVSKRWLRMAHLGDDYAIAKLQEIEDQIEVIRNS